MSKNLKRASDWIQKQIEDLHKEASTKLNMDKMLQSQAEDLMNQAKELSELIEKLPVENEKQLTS